MKKKRSSSNVFNHTISHKYNWWSC